ncbi:hypothetical protein ACTXT7_001324 [Hymenolepis weldensis]
MAGSPIRAPLSNLIFPQPEEKSPLMTGNTGSPISGMQSRSPTYSRFPEGPFFNENIPSSPPMKKRCLDVSTEQEHLPQQQHQSTASSTGEAAGTTQQAHDCSSDSLQTSSTSLSPKVILAVVSKIRTAEERASRKIPKKEQFVLFDITLEE